SDVCSSDLFFAQRPTALATTSSEKRVGPPVVLRIGCDGLHVIVNNLTTVMPSHLPTALPCTSIADPASVDYRTSPVHLRAMAYLYGLDTPEVKRARVLELGCDAGLNLLPFALGYPQAQIVGVDINPEHVEFGQEKIRELGANNYQLFAV